MKFEVVMKLTSMKFGKRSMIVKKIEYLATKYASMMIRYTNFFTNRGNFIFTTATNTAYKIVMNCTNFDLCELLRL